MDAFGKSKPATPATAGRYAFPRPAGKPPADGESAVAVVPAVAAVPVPLPSTQPGVILAAPAEGGPAGTSAKPGPASPPAGAAGRSVSSGFAGTNAAGGRIAAVMRSAPDPTPATVATEGTPEQAAPPPETLAAGLPGAAIAPPPQSPATAPIAPAATAPASRATLPPVATIIGSAPAPVQAAVLAVETAPATCPEEPKPSAARSTAPLAPTAGFAATTTLVPDGHRVEVMVAIPSPPAIEGVAHRAAEDAPVGSPRQTSGPIDAVAPAAAPLDGGRPATPPPVYAQVARGIVTHAEMVSRPGVTDFHLQIEPPNLGTVQIHLTATEHTLTARLVVSHEQTQALMAGQENDLRQVLAQSGITLTGFDVSRNGGEPPRRGDQPPPRTEPTATPPKQKPRSTQARAVPTDSVDLIA